MQPAVWLCMLWGVLWFALRSVGYAGAVPVTFTRDNLYDIRAALPQIPVFSPDVLVSIRNLGLNVIPATVRGSRGGRNVLKSISQHQTCRNKFQNNHGGVNHKNLISIKPPFVETKTSDKEKLPLSFGLLNVRSIKLEGQQSKQTKLCEYISDFDPDIVALTETWLSETDNVALGKICPDGYNILSQPHGGRGGGVAIVYRSSLTIKQVTKLSFSTFEHAEVMVHSQDKSPLNLCIIYRPPPNHKNGFTCRKFFDKFSDFLDGHILSKERLLVCGDFNFHIDDNNDNQANEFLDLCTSYNLQQHVRSPTHCKGHILDLIFTRDADSLLKDLM